MVITAHPYSADQTELWNEFVADSRNGTFLFNRNYMDYHADRFTDASLMLRLDGKLIGLLPANRDGDVLISHSGLTYGGLVLDQTVGLDHVRAMLGAVIDAGRAQGCHRLIYKTIPSIYHRAPAQEDLWALHEIGATLIRRDALAVVPDGARPNRGRRRDISRAGRRQITVHRGVDDWAGFWNILSAQLAARHDATPVHSVAEMALLAERFPDDISLWTAQRDGALLAGSVLYRTPTCLHCQYSAASDLGRETRAMDLIHDAAIKLAHEHSLCFDFGISSEAGGTVLNAGLQVYKEGFGARAVMHDYYEINL
ncbi:MAG: GNAT family N-acetyltransferase [Rhodobacteraceae bacterium]|nr:GNAT family N-acetyltransferase [Paracoccaceae bacterium]